VPASVKIIVTSIGSPIPTAHTGEPWAGSLYWQLAGLLGLAGFVLIGVGVRRRRGLRHV
jgi:MYXO-CTERM domain-containing protein